MKPALLIATFATLLAAHADVDIKREEAASIKGYDIPELNSKAQDLEGQIVRIKFNYRGTDLVDLKDGFSRGRLMIWRTDSRAGRAGSQYGYIQARIPAAALPWFRKLTTNDTARQTLTVIARVDKMDTERATVELLGREVKTDTKGSHIIW